MPKDILTLKKGNASQIPVSNQYNIPQPEHPSFGRQAERIGPKFQDLLATLDAQRARLQVDPDGIDPAMVLVFEVVGDVKKFLKASKRIMGLEWEGEMDSQTEPDNDFFNLKDGIRQRTPVAEKLYLTFTNETALNQLLSLWRRYSEGYERFPMGFAPFKEVFSRLKDIRKWGVQDRFIETNVADEWRRLLESRRETIRFEIELWFHNSSEKRRNAEEAVEAILNRIGGRIVTSVVYEQIAYHGLKVECPAAEIERMLEDVRDEENELLNADQIMWIRATGQMAAKAVEEESEELELDLDDNPSEAPVIALLDGLPMANHSLLQNRLIINDVEGYEDTYPANRRNHATAMASLIIHGDLNNRLAPLEGKVYVRPIMRPIDADTEGVPEEELLVDVIHKAVKEIEDIPELASTIRVVNLSVGNAKRPFDNMLSPEAKMLDWLSQRYNLLFVVSSGNHPRNFMLDMNIGEFKRLSDEEVQKELYDYLWNDSQNMRILSPSESINALTVGALNSDTAQVPAIEATFNPIKNGYPALYSRFGGGFKRAIKPDCLNTGGRDLYYHLNIDSQDAILRLALNRSKNGPGLKTAIPYNGINGTSHSFGTSNAAALTSRLCAEALKVIKSIPSLNLPSEYEAIAIKAMVAHSCRWREMGEDFFNNYGPQTPRKQREETLRMIGYGYPSLSEILCTDQRVTLIGYGNIRQNQQMEFSFPLPPCLITQAVKKRLIITLAWFSPIDPLGNTYRLARLSFEAKNNEEIAKKRSDADQHAPKRGTLQHEIFEGENAAMFEDGDELKIVVSCKKEENLTIPVNFVIMVTLETSPGTELQIYEEVRNRLRQPIQVINQ